MAKQTHISKARIKEKLCFPLSNSDSEQQGRKPSFIHVSKTYLLTQAQLLKQGMAQARGLKSKTTERFQASTAVQLRPSLLRPAGQRNGLDERRHKTQIPENAVINSHPNSIRDHDPRFRVVGKRRRRKPLWLSHEAMLQTTGRYWGKNIVV